MDYEISAKELVERRERNEEIVLVDVREGWERAAAMIAGSVHIPLEDVPSRVQELDPDKHIVVYCHHGIRSMMVTDWLRKQGYEAVQSLAGGISRWSAEVDPAVPRY